MSSGLEDVVSGALYNEIRMSTLANNIANMSTSGFKEDRVSFQLPGQEASDVTPVGTGSPVIDPQTTYVGKPVQTYTNFSAGRIVNTGNPLDVALGSGGFFKISTPDGVRYTRAGSFMVNAEGTLVNPDGFPVMGQGGEIQVDTAQGGAITIGESGEIFVDGGSVGQLEIVDFSATAGLVKVGHNLFAPAADDVEEQEPEQLRVMQGALEGSNVDPVKSMTEMIEVLRGYESYQKVIQFLNEANVKVVNEVGRL